ncbi:MAG TPA: protease inhibitor I42 family protein [Methanocella sp.]|uniref:protease inhibitor I42 family protein n=1 Tax=Methanocella sp. TaxID=2052833 RepID=UPI002BFD3F5C|nr:protease inhibitor I42 family protein [Methanocella sp.]HTY92228.1 protease inhibitor I42 family protein [Methanocella sp.]
MKTAYLISSSIIVVLLCVSVIAGNAQSYSPLFSISSLDDLSSQMSTYMNNLPQNAMQQSSQLPGYNMSMPYSGIYNFDTTPFTNSNTNQINVSRVNSSSFTMPIIDLSGFSSSTLMPMLLSDSVTQTTAGVQPNSTNNYTLDDNGSTINMKVNDTIYVQLPFHINTGGVWNVTVTNGLNITGQRTLTPLLSASSTPGNMDLTAIQEFDVQAVSPGTHYIKGICSGSNKTYMLTVIVS